MQCPNDGLRYGAMNICFFGFFWGGRRRGTAGWTVCHIWQYSEFIPRFALRNFFCQCLGDHMGSQWLFSGVYKLPTCPTHCTIIRLPLLSILGILIVNKKQLWLLQYQIQLQCSKITNFNHFFNSSLYFYIYSVNDFNRIS